MHKRKLICIFLVFCLSFFAYTSNLKAIIIKGRFLNLSGFDNASYSLNQIQDKRPLNNIGIFIAGNEHVYCIEPAEPLTTTGYTNNASISLTDTTYTESKYIKGDSTKRTLVSRILTFAYKSPNPANAGKSEYHKIAAAQLLIWEVVTGERTNFLTIKPQNSKKGNNSIYNVLHNSSNSNVIQIKNEYDRIVKNIQGTFSLVSGNLNDKFRSDTVAKDKKQILTWDSDIDKYTLEIKDANLKYWEVENNSGLTVTKKGDTLTITSSEPITEGNAKQIKISNIPSNDVATAKIYYDEKHQDVVTIYATKVSRYLYVYTPKFQMQVVKTGSLKLDGSKPKPLEGVKLKLYSDKNCTGSVLATLTTDKDGIATYNLLPKPGTYCIKEESTIKGYELDNKTVYKVKVTKDNVSGTDSFGTINITNKNKEVNLTKTTKDSTGKIVILDDGCGTDLYTGPEFEILENGNPLYFKEIKPGEYDYSSEGVAGSTTKIKTCNGKFKVYTLPNCNYTITETSPPKGLTLPGEPSKDVNVCGSDKNISFTNGFTGVEFQKKDEDGNFISGGKFSIQRKENNIYKDILLKEKYKGYYEYVEGLTEDDNDASYIFETSEEDYELGKAFIDNLPPGQYRIVEKEAPEGFELIEDKDSTALVTIKDIEKDYYLVELINRKSNKEGSKSSAELIVTITTGRKVPNYILIIGALTTLLVITIILRKKTRK